MQGEWRVNHEHNGIEVSFPGKPSQQVIDSLKANGFRWSGFSKVWYAKDYPSRRDFLNTIATQGEDVEASGKSFAEKFEEKQERAEARQERYEGYAESAQGEANRRFATAHTMASAIPMGQPVHGVRDRNYRERIGQNMDKGIEAQRRADYLERRAESAGAQLKGYDNPAFLQRRIKECEAEIRRLERNKSRYGNELDNWQRYYDETKSKLDFCRERLAALGGISYRPDNLHKGDLVQCHGSLGLIRRVNTKTVTVDYLDPQTECLYLLKSVSFEDIKNVTPATEVRPMLEKAIAEHPGTPTSERTQELLDEYFPATPAKVIPLPDMEERAQVVAESKPVSTKPMSTADKIRAALKVAFPGVKFSVRTDGCAINVRWADGPAYTKVEPVAEQYKCVSYDEASGEILSGGNTFVFCHRDVSPALSARALAAAQKEYGLTETDPARMDFWDSKHYHETLSAMDA